MKKHRIRSVYSGLKIFALLICFLLRAYCNTAVAQTKAADDTTIKEPTSKQARDLKVLKEYSDGRGNIVREVQYTQGSMRVTEMIIIPKPVAFNPRVPINPDTLVKDSLTIIVDKSRYAVQLFYRKKMIRSYKAVFGPNPKMDKCMEGDRCTPEGWFKIAAKNPASKYTKFMLLNYPNDSTYRKFNQLKEAGKIPKTARIGSAIGIHGIWKGGDDMIEMGVGWTDGCVALKNRDIEELYSFVGIGTRVFIRK